MSAIIEFLPADAVAELRQAVSGKRYQHCVRVAETCFHIAHQWKMVSIDETELAWAGLFHDCAKEFNAQERKKWLAKGECPFGNDLLDAPSLVHGALGSSVLYHRYGIASPDALKAVAYHSTGHPDLTPIGWIVYIADILEPGRTFIANRLEILEEVCKDPLTGLRLVTDLRHEITESKDRPVHPVALRFKDYIDSIETLTVPA